GLRFERRKFAFSLVCSAEQYGSKGELISSRACENAGRWSCEIKGAESTGTYRIYSPFTRTIDSALAWTVATCRRFPDWQIPPRRDQFQSAVMPAHSKLGQCRTIALNWSIVA